MSDISLTFRQHIDTKDNPPEFKELPNEYAITAYKGQHGRYISKYLQVSPGEKYTISGNMDRSENAIPEIYFVFYDGINYKSIVVPDLVHDINQDEPLSFVATITVPEAFTQMRLDLRAWKGFGSYAWTNIALVAGEITDPPDITDPEFPEGWDTQYVEGIMHGRFITLEIIPPYPYENTNWTCLKVSGKLFGHNLALYVEEPSEPEVTFKDVTLDAQYIDSQKID